MGGTASDGVTVSRGRSDGSPYGRVAELYDRVYAWKDYAREARAIRALARQFGPPGARSLLDVASGTGAHLRYLARAFDCTGVEPSRSMLAVARRNVRAAHFVRGAMPRFDLGRTFDVVTCLFSAIGYVRTESALETTLQTFERHLAPGGVVIVEPWLTPSAWRPGRIHLLTVPSEEDPIARLDAGRTVDGRSEIDMHYLAAARGRVLHWVEHHDLGLFAPTTMHRAFRSAGLRARRIRSGFYAPGRKDRGLYVAVRPGSVEGPRRTSDRPTLR